MSQTYSHTETLSQYVRDDLPPKVVVFRLCLFVCFLCLFGLVWFALLFGGLFLFVCFFSPMWLLLIFYQCPHLLLSWIFRRWSNSSLLWLSLQFSVPRGLPQIPPGRDGYKLCSHCSYTPPWAKRWNTHSQNLEFKSRCWTSQTTQVVVAHLLSLVI